MFKNTYSINRIKFFREYLAHAVHANCRDLFTLNYLIDFAPRLLFERKKPDFIKYLPIFINAAEDNHVLADNSTAMAAAVSYHFVICESLHMLPLVAVQV